MKHILILLLCIGGQIHAETPASPIVISVSMTGQTPAYSFSGHPIKFSDLSSKLDQSIARFGYLQHIELHISPDTPASVFAPVFSEILTCRFKSRIHSLATISEPIYRLPFPTPDFLNIK